MRLYVVAGGPISPYVSPRRRILLYDITLSAFMGRSQVA
jgi:hypothetical protein